MPQFYRTPNKIIEFWDRRVVVQEKQPDLKADAKQDKSEIPNARIVQKGLENVSAGGNIYVQIIQNAGDHRDIRDKAFGEKNNPFQPLNGRIEDSEQFFNREKELREIFDILNAGSGVELLGDRQIGKSSILQQIKHRADSQLAVKRKTIYLNLHKVHTEMEFYESFCEELGIANCTGIDLNRAMRSKRVLLLLDETENLQGNGFTREIRDRLRAFAEDGSLRLVVAACTPLERLFPDSHQNGMTSPFQGICLRVELKPWDQATVQKFVAVRLENTGICFSEEEMEKLWQDSQGYPQKLMKACFDLYRQYR
ncbi:MAG: AAA family ATPase, partial [Pseudanabaena sp. ELA607]